MGGGKEGTGEDESNHTPGLPKKQKSHSRKIMSRSPKTWQTEIMSLYLTNCPDSKQIYFLGKYRITLYTNIVKYRITHKKYRIYLSIFIDTIGVDGNRWESMEVFNFNNRKKHTHIERKIYIRIYTYTYIYV